MTEPTTTALVPTVDFTPYDNAEVHQAARASQLIQHADRAVVNDVESMRLASELDGMLGACIKQVEDERLSWTKGLNAQVTRFNTMFKAVSGPLKARREALKGKMIAWDRSERERIAKEAAEQRKREEDERLRVAAAQEAEATRLRKIAEEAKVAGDAAQAEILQQAADNKQAQADMSVDDAANTPPPAPVYQGPVRGNTGSVTGIQQHWVFEVEDLDKVSRKYLIIDEKMVNAAIKGKHGARDIPGLRIYDKGKVTTR